MILLCKRQESQAARHFSTVLRDTCRPYALQRRRNELKYSFNCQNMFVFHEYIFQFFITNILPASNGVKHQNFMGETLNVSCRCAIDNASALHVSGPRFDSRRWILHFSFSFVLLSCFEFFFFVNKFSFFDRLKIYR